MSNVRSQPGSPQAAIAEIEQLLGTDAALAADRAQRILDAHPGHPEATLYLGIARRLTGDAARAVEILEPLARSHPDHATVQYEFGRACSAAGYDQMAVPALRRAVALNAALPGAWVALADQLRAMGDAAAANAVCDDRIRLAVYDSSLRNANAALRANRIKEAEGILRQQLQNDPTDVVAIRLLAEVAVRLGQMDDAVTLLKRCLELAPSYSDARYSYAAVLHMRREPADALREIRAALKGDPGNPAYRNLFAVLLGQIGEFDRANEVYAAVLAEYPQQPMTWMSHGHALLAAGRQADCIAAYRKSIELCPSLGEAWWSLANLKTVTFTNDEIADVRRHLDSTELSHDDRLHFEFTLGKALEDAGDYAGSFAHYAQGNHLYRARVKYDPAEVTRYVRRARALFTDRFFADRQGCGNPARAPIFVVGLPRAGSTLVEQILASHPAVEGTGERPDVIAIADELGGRNAQAGMANYPEALAGLEPNDLWALGERYLASTRVQRGLNRPMFVDKMPNNFAHVGLIHLMLPNARIIDARRHPLACGFSCFKQHFARGQHFTYELGDIGQYYRDYVELMAHFDQVLPGRIYRVYYERLVEDFEAEVRRLLDYCTLSFDERCLRPHESSRAVTSASSEQVRQPVNQSGVDHWRHFEAWLDPLKNALGPVLDAYPNVPAFDPASPA